MLKAAQPLLGPAPQSTEPSCHFLPEDYEPEAYDNECNFKKLHPTFRRRYSEPKKCRNKASLTRPDRLPLCKLHQALGKDTYIAARCEVEFAISSERRRCDRLFRWFPPHKKACRLHWDDVSAPAYLLKLPAELRFHIFRYLFSGTPIGSDMSESQNEQSSMSQNDIRQYILLCGVSRQTSHDARAVFCSLPFTIDIRREGILMCGRWFCKARDDAGNEVNLYGNRQYPSRMDTYLPYTTGDLDARSKTYDQIFIKYFPFLHVRNYHVDILFEESPLVGWDREVEIYDIRDLVGFATKNILKKSEHLNSVNTRVAFKDREGILNHGHAMIETTKTLTEPLMRLHRVKAPFLGDIMSGEHCSITARQHSLCRDATKGTFDMGGVLIYAHENPSLAEYKRKWEDTTRNNLESPPDESPIRHAFSQFKKLYGALVVDTPGLRLGGKESVLHRLRVAREHSDYTTFSEILSPVIPTYIQAKEQLKDRHLSIARMHREAETKSRAKDKQNDKLVSRLERFMVQCQSTAAVSPGLNFNQSSAPVVDIPDVDFDEAAKKMTVQERLECLRSLPPMQQDMMRADRARADESIKLLQAEVASIRAELEHKYIVRGLQMQHSAYELSTSARDQDVRNRQFLPTPPSSSKSHIGHVEGTASQPMSLTSSSQSHSSDACAARPSDCPRRLAVNPRSDCFDGDWPTAQDEAQPSVSYIGKGKRRADSIIVID
ncbi:hypothetical protein EJ05DRAFT_487236 [Pseudovirgaria hyperparasitica]|uniref:Uncharacterized protein n=1 Tax=Pseudovirgaria hyperparasitica TaxID=470096 RepID=A0A6A6W2Y4_9PEZI|nr:uncharacterized protein EJ05DRAFT_487236 [Pseudovirgaria hyperparasitica]KAF2756320.1 hypothetical protein EJ05DRAFT_487236 [Pseudovirgaria hyperparasitica]